MTKRTKTVLGLAAVAALAFVLLRRTKRAVDGKITIGNLTVGRDAQGRCVCERNEQLADGTLKLTRVALDECREDPQLVAQLELLCGGPASDDAFRT